MIDHASTDRHAAHRMPDDDGVGQVEVFENLDEIAPRRLEGDAVSAGLGAAVTSHVPGDHPEAIGQQVKQRAPHPPLQRYAVQQHQRLTAARLDEVQGSAVTGRDAVVRHVFGWHHQLVEIDMVPTADPCAGDVDGGDRCEDTEAHTSDDGCSATVHVPTVSRPLGSLLTGTRTRSGRATRKPALDH